jgi:RNA polymerase sigma factor (sigma-70 family)
LVVPYLPEAYALARAITGNRADAEDVVQDACLRALRAISGLAIANPRAWMLTIVHNTAYTWLGKNRPAAIVAVDDLELAEQSSSHGGDQNTPERAVIAKSEAAHLEAAIAALPTGFRETLVLRDIEGLNYKEIAEITGVPIGTVMSRLTRARSRLITLLGRAAT